MKSDIKRHPIARQVVLFVAFAIGIVHLFDAMKIVFTFPNNVPLTDIIWTVTGFVATLPLAILSIYTFRVAGPLYVFFALISFGIIITKVHDWRAVLWFILYNCIITASIGIVMMLIHKAEMKI
jgi:hypothetical protein